MMLRVLFCNIQQGLALFDEKFSHGPVMEYYRPDLFQSALARHQPDVVGMAEVPMTPQGDGAFLDGLAQAMDLPFRATSPDAPSWLVPDSFYGTAILSRWPIDDHRIILLPNPGLTTTWVSGETVQMHDKRIQLARIHHPARDLEWVNLHGPAFHKFKSNLRQHPQVLTALLQTLIPQGAPRIVTGDFNNKHEPLTDLLPELVGLKSKGKLLRDAVSFNMDDYFADESPGQIDHILCTPHFMVERAVVDKGVSDHPILVADLEWVE